MSNMTKKHVLALAAGALMLGATTASAEPMRNKATMSANPDGLTQVRYDRNQVRKHHVIRRHATRARINSADWGPLGLPFAAAAGVGTTAGAVIGGTTAALTGYPYDPVYGSYAYAGPVYGGYAYADPAYGSYAFVPSAGVGLGVDRSHSFYNGFGVRAPASQDNCAGDGGYGRRDYAIGC